MFEQMEALVEERSELERRLADPSVHADQTQARRLGRRYAELGPVVAAYAAWKQATDDLATARELAVRTRRSRPKRPSSKPRSPSSRSGCESCSSRGTRTTTAT